MELGWIAGTDGQAAADALVANAARLREAEVTEFRLAAHWADLHNPDSVHAGGDRGRVVPGTERVREVGGSGSPPVAEFAVPELAVTLGRSVASALSLLADAVDVRHRHPLLDQGLESGRVLVWQARKIAARTRAVGLSLEQARFVDRAVAPLVGVRPWARVLDAVEAAIVAADRVGAAERARVAALEQFVSTGRCTEHGLKTLVAKAAAGDVVFFDAMVGRIAEILLLEGETGPVGVRRARAIGILADPIRALALLAAHATPDTDTAGGPDADPAAVADAATPDTADGADDSDDADLNRDAAVAADPSSGLADPADGGPAAAAAAAETADLDRDDGAPEGLAPGDLDPVHDDSDDVPEGAVCAGCGRPTGPNGRGGGLVGDPAAFAHALARVDPTRLLPAATLYVHLAREDLPGDGADAGAGTGVARVEGIGPVLASQAAAFLRHRRVTVVPVIDLADLDHPVDGYEVPTRMREQLRLRGPGSVFPYAPTTGRRMDADHTVPYLPPARGGPPGQTRIDNLGLLDRHGHRVKTHAAGWVHRQPRPGVHLWRTPHGYWYRVDNTGTHPLGPHPSRFDLTGGRPHPRSPHEHALAAVLRAHEARDGDEDPGR